MNRSTPGLSVHHHLPEFTQTHVHRVSDAIQPSHPLSSPSPPAPNPSQHQSLPMSQLFATLEVKSLSRVRLFATPWTSSLPGSSVHGIPQGRIWNGLPCPPPEDLPNPEIKPRSPPLQQNSLPAEPPGKPSEAPRIYFCDNVFFAISLSLSRLL